MASVWSQYFVLFSFVSSGYQWGYTVDPVSAKRPVEHFKNVLQNITTDRTPHSVHAVYCLPLCLFPSMTQMYKNVQERKETLTASGKFWEIRALNNMSRLEGPLII